MSTTRAESASLAAEVFPLDAHEREALAKAAGWAALAGITHLVRTAIGPGLYPDWYVFLTALAYGLMLPVIAVLHTRHARVRDSGAVLGTIIGTVVVAIGMGTRAAPELAARAFLRAYLAPTPLIRRDALSASLGLDVWLKCENLLPTAAFKVRGGLNLIGRDPTAKAGVMGASTGNHGQSLAYAGGVFGVPVTIFVPKGANPLKLAAMRRSGATIVEHGDDYDDAREECERRAAATGTRYVHSGNEPYLIAGVATAALEVLSERPDVDAFIVPVGGGSGAAGAALVAKTLRPEMTVVGVQAEGASAAYRAWRDRAPRTTERAATFADGLATR